MSDSDGTIGSRIRVIRGSLSQDEFATQMRVHKNTLGKYERGDRFPDFAFMQRLIEIGYNMNWFLTGEGAMSFDVGNVGMMPGGRAQLSRKQKFDEDLAAIISRAISNLYREENARLTEDDRGRLLARIYNALSSFEDHSDRLIALGEQIAQLRSNLRSSSVDQSGKRLA